MQRRMQIDTDVLQEIGIRLTALAQLVGAFRFSSTGLNVTSKSIRLPSVHMRSVNYTVSGSSLDGWIRQCETTLSRLGNHADKLGQAVRKAAMAFATTERRLLFFAQTPGETGDPNTSPVYDDAMNKVLAWLRANDGSPPPFSWLSGDLLKTVKVSMLMDPYGAMYFLKDVLTQKYGKEKSVSGSIGFNGSPYSKGFTNKYGGGSFAISALKAEASYNAGLFTVDKNGNLVFNPSFGASIGAEYALLTGTIDQRVQISENLAVGAGADATIGKVSAKAGASVGMFNPDGSFNPHARLGASAQANLVEVNARGNIDVFGIDTTIEGGVVVGWGAEFNVGLDDGVFKFDLGAAIFVGGSTSISIDVGGAVSAAKGACESAGKAIVGGAKKVGGFIKKGKFW